MDKAFTYGVIPRAKRVAYANVCPELMPTEERGEIGSIKPSGWHTVKYNGIVDGNYLYNRCHLIAYCLTAENANKKNLITGTRYLNNEGMLPYEIKVAQYVEDTGNHVLYRVTPVFEGNNLLASGIMMEAYSVEDKGKGISFCVYAYNVQPGITINYKNGDSKLSSGANAGSGSSSPEGAVNDAVNAIIESDYETLMEKCIPDDYFSGIEDTYGIDVKEFYNSLSGLYGTKKFNKNIDYSIKKVKQASSSEYKRFKKYFIYNEIPGMSLNTNKITDLFYITVEFVEYSSKGKVIDDETATLQVYKYDGKWYVYQLKEISILE